eukprot:6471191-Amphidinium_carterae.1
MFVDMPAFVQVHEWLCAADRTMETMCSTNLKDCLVIHTRAGSARPHQCSGMRIGARSLSISPTAHGRTAGTQ